MQITDKRIQADRSGSEPAPTPTFEAALGTTRRPSSLAVMPIPNGRRTSTAQSDGELMAKVSAGSVESFGELYDRYRDRAHRVARAVCRDEGRAPKKLCRTDSCLFGTAEETTARTRARSQHGC